MFFPSTHDLLYFFLMQNGALRACLWNWMYMIVIVKLDVYVYIICICLRTLGTSLCAIALEIENFHKLHVPCIIPVGFSTLSSFIQE